MEAEAIKLELIEWLTGVQDQEVLNYLKSFKEELLAGEEWYDQLPEKHKAGIARGLKDLEEGRIISHEEVMKKYGL